ncbi:MAG: 30S ribosomal protein S8 [Candidatus Hodgkinia cicadicola]
MRYQCRNEHIELGIRWRRRGTCDPWRSWLIAVASIDWKFGTIDKELDPTAEVVSRINNCIKAKRKVLRMESSKFKLSLIKILEKMGCVTRIAIIARDGRRAELMIELKYVAGRSMARRIKQISRPGRREYWTARQAKFAAVTTASTFVLSTNVGLLSANESSRIGGEIICEVKW